MSVEKNWWENTKRGGKRSSRGERLMLITRAPFDEELAHVPEEATRSDSLLKRLDELLDDDDLLEHVRADCARRYQLTTQHGRHSTPVEVILRLFVLKQLFNWGFEQTEKQVRKSPLLQWFCRITDEASFQTILPFLRPVQL